MCQPCVYVIALAMTISLFSTTSNAQCWNTQEITCYSQFQDTPCSATPCVDDECPEGTVEYETLPNSFFSGVSGASYGFEGTTLTSNYVYCIRKRDCENDCDIYSGENRCANGLIDLFADPLAKDAGKRYHEMGTGFCYLGFFE